MAPKKIHAYVLESSSSEDATAIPTHPILVPILVCRTEGVDCSNWNKMLPRFFFPKIDVSNIDIRWVDWVVRMEPRYKGCWLDHGIYHAITCSTIQLQANSPLLGLALVFWNSASNTFDFGIGPMSISILDLVVIFGFRPHGQSADWLGDFQENPLKEQERKENLEILSGLIGSNRVYGAFMGAFMNQTMDYPHGEHIMFMMDIATGPLVLGSIYRALREATIAPVNLNVKGPMWMDMLIYQGPKDANNSLASGNMDVFSCLQLLDLPYGGRMDYRNNQYGVEAYNP
ncbi:unnamed protein product [Prunus armeniaca]|uniref:Aminotransferase-like plant mobile domain-containing protein n=1 Tax=Prunus armeniaca TaxID=36596 RepID=A0A6J5TXG3_PRUAR|nr:unnamed protein product [Prunus armeniaca]